MILLGWHTTSLDADRPGRDTVGMADDYGIYGRPAAIGARTIAVMIADLWGQTINETSPYAPSSPGALVARLKRIEAKLDTLLSRPH